MNLSTKLSINEMQEIQAGKKFNANCAAGWCCFFGGMLTSELGVGCFAIAAGTFTIAANC
ncbi:MAG: hypothetical protein JZU53_00375 [Paludibacter sp.]|nr:hypothetical protein [Paludibacter sp.]